MEQLRKGHRLQRHREENTRSLAGVWEGAPESTQGTPDDLLTGRRDLRSVMCCLGKTQKDKQTDLQKDKCKQAYDATQPEPARALVSTMTSGNSLL